MIKKLLTDRPVARPNEHEGGGGYGPGPRPRLGPQRVVIIMSILLLSSGKS